MKQVILSRVQERENMKISSDKDYPNPNLSPRVKHREKEVVSEAGCLQQVEQGMEIKQRNYHAKTLGVELKPSQYT